MHRRLAVLPVVALVLATGGCATTSKVAASSSVPIVDASSPTSSLPSSAPSTSAAAGSVSSSDKSFSLVLPSGWKPTSHGSDQIFAAKAPSADGTVVSTVNVISASPTKMPNLDDVVTSGELQMRQDGASVSALPSRTIGGEPAQGYSAQRKVKDADITQMQYFVIHGATIFTITTTAATSTAPQLIQLTGGLLDSWAWAS